MKQCWRCRTTKEATGLHHIDGNSNNSVTHNLIRLCKRCHDLAQGICDQCKIQSSCGVRYFTSCWGFDGALPPIHFRKKEALESDPENEKSANPLKVLNNTIKTRKMKNPNDSAINEPTPKCLGCGEELSPIRFENGHTKCIPCIRKINHEKANRTLAYYEEFVFGKSKSPRVIKQCNQICGGNAFCPFINQTVSYCHKRDWS